MEPVDDAGALVDQVIVPFGQQPQDRRPVFRLDLAQVEPEEGNLGDVLGVGRIGLAVPAVGQEFVTLYMRVSFAVRFSCR
jgi:hypothetical protein